MEENLDPGHGRLNASWILNRRLAGGMLSAEWHIAKGHSFFTDAYGAYSFPHKTFEYGVEGGYRWTF